MTEVLLHLLSIVIIIVLILLTIAVKRMSHEIDELKAKLEHHRIKLNYLEFDYLSISDYEKRLNQLEEALEFIDNDELVEVTPDAIRLRKKILNEKERFRSNR